MAVFKSTTKTFPIFFCMTLLYCTLWPTFTIFGLWRKISAGKSWKTTSARNSQALTSNGVSRLWSDLSKWEGLHQYHWKSSDIYTQQQKTRYLCLFKTIRNHIIGCYAMPNVSTSNHLSYRGPGYVVNTCFSIE